MANLKNINFMGKERFDELTETSLDELYAVKQSVTGAADWDNAIDIKASVNAATSSSRYYFETEGWFVAAGGGDNGWCYINDIPVGFVTTNGGSGWTSSFGGIFVWVNKGDNVYRTTALANAYLVPCKE